MSRLPANRRSAKRPSAFGRAGTLFRTAAEHSSPLPRTSVIPTPVIGWGAVARWLKISALVFAVAGIALALMTVRAMDPFASDELRPPSATVSTHVVARDGTPLNDARHDRWRQDPWNYTHQVALHEIPPLVREAFIQAEDRRFLSHGGIDWFARIHAVWSNVTHWRKIRGASTISEQVVRILNPRPRTTWSRWIEGFEAMRLEHRFSKSEILSFYLNQVPFAAERRGVAQAARYYFDRPLDALQLEEVCALAVMIRAPSTLNPHRHARSGETRNTDRLHRTIERLGRRLVDIGEVSDAQWTAARDRLAADGLALAGEQPAPNARHFVEYALATPAHTDSATLRATLHPSLQQTANRVLLSRLQQLRAQNVNNAAALVVDHLTDEVLVWSVGSTDPNTAAVNAVTTRRQPGSTLKPFVYALALEQGWDEETMILDEPLTSAVRNGSHRYRNYSRRHYGPVTLRVALGNSLNIPAVKALRAVGTERLLDRMDAMGIGHLHPSPDFYGDGLALGNAELSLHDLVTAYATLARGGEHAKLRWHHGMPIERERVFGREISARMGAMLADPTARHLEFGAGNPLEMPHETAAKTGTSSAYHDAWAIGFNHQFTVGVWMGNLDRTPTDGVTGSNGPALVLRTLFAELNRLSPPRPLARPRPSTGSLRARQGQVLTFDSRPLRQREGVRSQRTDTPPVVPYVRRVSVAPTPHIESARSRPLASATPRSVRGLPRPRLVTPTPGLHIALDPRVPIEHQHLTLELDRNVPRAGRAIRWYLNGTLLGENDSYRWRWPLSRGRHVVRAELARPSGDSFSTEAVAFYVR